MKIEPVTLTEEVVFYDTDCGGVVSNIAYLRYVEKARCLLFDQLGMGLKEMSRTRVFPTVVRSEIDYKSPAVLGDSVVVEAEFEKIEKLRIRCRYLLFREEDDAVDERHTFAEAKQVVVLVKMPDGKPTRVPKEWL